MTTRLTIGSRGSKLALWQANWVRDQLLARYADLTVEIQIIKTTGDKLRDVSLAVIGGRGVFTKEIEEALLSGQVDLAVHSLKDLPTMLPAGLQLAAITEREDVHDVLLSKFPVQSLQELPAGTTIGTGSLRRQAQIRALRPDLLVRDLRGNVDTRIQKWQSGEYDAIILAAAGLVRLGYTDVITTRIPFDEMLPAIGQGALGIETRLDATATNELLDFLNHRPTRAAVLAERALLRALGGGCQVPIAAQGSVTSEQLTLRALVASLDGQQLIKQQLTGTVAEAEQLGTQLAEQMMSAGAKEILHRVFASDANTADLPLS